MNQPPRKRPPADIKIAARARAREVRVHRAPEGGEVRFTGDPAPESWTREQRTNLPPELAEGETYRNIEIHWAAGARARTNRAAA